MGRIEPQFLVSIREGGGEREGGRAILAHEIKVKHLSQSLRFRRCLI